MRAVVALVETGPETISEDYRRVMDLAGMPRITGDGPTALVPVARTGGWLPGAGSPPWQLDGVLAWLEKNSASAGRGGEAAGRAPVVVPVSAGGGAVAIEAWAWADVVASHGAEVASSHFRRPRAFRAEPALPDLEAALADGLHLPAGLRDRTTLLLPTPVLGSGLSLLGAVDLLADLLAPGLRRSGSSRDLAARADVLRFAGQALPRLGVVMDAVFWQVGPVVGRRPAVARNILLAGRDPVAVDAVASRLAGRDPERDDWFRTCRDQDLGAVRASDIKLVGQAGLLDRDFGIPAGLTDGGAMDWARAPLERMWGRAFKGPAYLKRFARTPWGRLFDDYRAGGPAGDQG